MPINSNRGANATADANTRNDAVYTDNANSNVKGTARVASALNVIAGLWLIAAPWVLGYAAINTAMWNDLVVGILVTGLAAVRLFAPTRHSGVSWANVVLGVWLLAAPFVLAYGSELTGAGAAFWNDIIVGCAIILFGALSGDSTNNMVNK